MLDADEAVPRSPRNVEPANHLFGIDEQDRWVECWRGFRVLGLRVCHAQSLRVLRSLLLLKEFSSEPCCRFLGLGFVGVVPAEMVLAVTADLDSPFLLGFRPAHPWRAAALVVLVRPMAVQSILGDCEQSKVGAPVVELVAVGMVKNHAFRRRAEQPGMQGQHEAVGSAVGRVAGTAMSKPSQGRDVLAVPGVNEGKAAPSVGVNGDEGNSAVNGQRDDSVLAHVPASTTRKKETPVPRKVLQVVLNAQCAGP